ncbi:uncharacterized protein ARMOST_02464 [Armillaria ostoyae]|uniref:Uncharacterized protein n=1 Tax=Armillaria ostoyae TaxID=47428 RepID=A0A284QRT0_ARMOS|nr:uncharacterized protein ARMOST_02464 [Armillaria ostoyae]
MTHPPPSYDKSLLEALRYKNSVRLAPQPIHPVFTSSPLKKIACVVSRSTENGDVQSPSLPHHQVHEGFLKPAPEMEEDCLIGYWKMILGLVIVAIVSKYRAATEADIRREYMNKRAHIPHSSVKTSAIDVSEQTTPPDFVSRDFGREDNRSRRRWEWRNTCTLAKACHRTDEMQIPIWDHSPDVPVGVSSRTESGIILESEGRNLRSNVVRWKEALGRG